jgi:hypothetical protein
MLTGTFNSIIADIKRVLPVVIDTIFNALLLPV